VSGVEQPPWGDRRGWFLDSGRVRRAARLAVGRDRARAAPDAGQVRVGVDQSGVVLGALLSRQIRDFGHELLRYPALQLETVDRLRHVPTTSRGVWIAIR